MRRASLLSTPLAALLASCTVDAPFDPARFFGPLGDALSDAQNTLEGALADPLGAQPFPVLMGGDSDRIFYATNLGDVRVRFPGPTGDIVLPGVLGPSNVYVHQDKERALVRPLAPSSALFGLQADGEHVASVQQLDPLGDGPFRPGANRRRSDRVRERRAADRGRAAGRGAAL
ncbi:hypothetical protein RAS1_29790 [Phycisphaerae bacterium RAS1]|nr:hypothetical protein RAS1_29790 [Phycisphaerae bacterium RAS1]